MADAVGRFENGDPIFFYTWTPNWTVGELKPGQDVVWLQVKETKLPEEQAAMADATTVENLEGCRGEKPCNLGWPANDIRPVANSEFLEENPARSEEHTSELQSLMRISYAVFCLKKKKTQRYDNTQQ